MGQLNINNKIKTLINIIFKLYKAWFPNQKKVDWHAAGCRLRADQLDRKQAVFKRTYHWNYMDYSWVQQRDFFMYLERLWDMGGDSISLSGQNVMLSITTHSSLLSCLHGAGGLSSASSLLGWVTVPVGSSPQWGRLLSCVPECMSTEKLQRILRELGMLKIV